MKRAACSLKLLDFLVVKTTAEELRAGLVNLRGVLPTGVGRCLCASPVLPAAQAHPHPGETGPWRGASENLAYGCPCTYDRSIPVNAIRVAGTDGLPGFGTLPQLSTSTPPRFWLQKYKHVHMHPNRMGNFCLPYYSVAF